MVQHTFSLLLATLVFTLFCPYLFNVCIADDSGEVEIDADIKAERVPLKTSDNTVQIEEVAISNDGFSLADRKLLREEEPHKFEAEIHKLMGIIINSLYSNRDIFIRELISNAADALGKIRFLSLTDPSVLGNHPNLEIKIKADPEKNLLHIRDTGIGMTKEQLITHLGSIAKSGTKEFLEKMGSSDVTQIGQFGVGFYSSFLVADKVTVTSKHNDDDQYIWESTVGESTSYTIAKDPRGNTLERGTLITLHLKEDANQYLDPATLKNLVLKYNEFISYPIYVWASHEEERVVPTEPVEEVEEEITQDTEDIDIQEESEEEAPPATTKETVWSFEHVNIHPPLWTRKKSDITETEYSEFYKNILKDSLDPFYHVHFKAEGDVEFTALLYIPESLPYGYWDPSFRPNIRLYVKRVFITDDFQDMLPSYLGFVKGIVDSDDVGLNVSREMLQQDKNLAVIKKKLIRKIIGMIQEIEEDKEKYEKFYKTFGTSLKLGIIHDSQNRARLSKLIRFITAKDTDKLISLEDYVNNMKKSQKVIYYLGGENKEAILQSPLLERLTKRGYDVLILPDPIDEYAVLALGKYDGKYDFVDISKDGLKLDEDEEKQKNLKEEYKPLCEYLAGVLKDKVSRVEVSTRLTKSPVALVSSTYGYSANMERILKAQALKDSRYLPVGTKRILEINPRHPLIKKLLQDVANDEASENTEDIANVLYDSAVLNTGHSLEKPKTLADRVLKLVSQTLNIDPDEEVVEEEYVEEEEVVEEEVVEEEENIGESEEENQHEEL